MISVDDQYAGNGGKNDSNSKATTNQSYMKGETLTGVVKSKSLEEIHRMSREQMFEITAFYVEKDPGNILGGEFSNMEPAEIMALTDPDADKEAFTRLFLKIRHVFAYLLDATGKADIDLSDPHKSIRNLLYKYTAFMCVRFDDNPNYVVHCESQFTAKAKSNNEVMGANASLVWIHDTPDTLKNCVSGDVVKSNQGSVSVECVITGIWKENTRNSVTYKCMIAIPAHLGDRINATSTATYEDLKRNDQYSKRIPDNLNNDHTRGHVTFSNITTGADESVEVIWYEVTVSDKGSIIYDDASSKTVNGVKINSIMVNANPSNNVLSTVTASEPQTLTLAKVSLSIKTTVKFSDDKPGTAWVNMYANSIHHVYKYNRAQVYSADPMPRSRSQHKRTQMIHSADSEEIIAQTALAAGKLYDFSKKVFDSKKAAKEDKKKKNKN